MQHNKEVTYMFKYKAQQIIVPTAFVLLSHYNTNIPYKDASNWVTCG